MKKTYIIRHIEVKDKNLLQRVLLIIRHYIKYPHSIKMANNGENYIFYKVKITNKVQCELTRIKKEKWGNYPVELRALQ